MYLQFERRSNLNRLSPLQIFIHNFQSLQLPYFTLIYELFCDNISVSQNNLCLLWYCHYKFIFNVILYYFFLFTCHISSSYLVLSCCICGGRIELPPHSFKHQLTNFDFYFFILVHSFSIISALKLIIPISFLLASNFRIATAFSI